VQVLTGELASWGRVALTSTEGLASRSRGPTEAAGSWP
jgi:hypothetical protein